MLEATPYTLLHVGFSKQEEPILALEVDSEVKNIVLDQEALTLSFDTSIRYCTGWHDLKTGTSHVCPDTHEVDKKYDQCPACQKRTGFNPAFYNATSISAKQQERNKEPHTLYLAHFSPGVLKVGISHGPRRNVRLLEQGARSALILGTFDTADEARSHEARIAALPSILETLQVRKKISFLETPYNQERARQELLQAKEMIENSLARTFTGSTVMSFDDIYFRKDPPLLRDLVDVTDKEIISGTLQGMLGTLLFCQQQDTLIFMYLKKYVGYKVIFSSQETKISLPTRQISLF